MPGRAFQRRRWFGWFRPNFIQGMAVWYDPTRQTDADGADIATLTDYSGNAKDANQATAGDRPVMTYNAQNGRKAALFSGGFASGDYMDAGDNLDLDTHGFVMYVAWKPTLTLTGNKQGIFIQKGGACVIAGCLGGYGVDIFWPSASAESAINIVAWMIDDIVAPYNNSDITYNGGAAVNNTWSIVGVISVLGAVPMEMYLNGTSVGTPSGASPATTSGLNNSKTFNVGRGDAPGVDWRANGYIGEVIVYHIDSLSNDNRMKLDGYFCHKWGLSASMDPAHPYYHYPP